MIGRVHAIFFQPEKSNHPEVFGILTLLCSESLAMRHNRHLYEWSSESGGRWQGAIVGNKFGDRGGTHCFDLSLSLANRTIVQVDEIHVELSPSDGGAIQIYCALIASLMLPLLTGKRPSKRMMELEELMELLALEEKEK